ncbi:hypothetical protein GUA87_15425 [Sneathiella sp. P13V-1]|nr:hypothetical protein [Sneathiella sp. P13V-1]
MHCGECGEALTIVQTNTYGCSNHRKKGICKNDAHIDRAEMERRVLANLKRIMSDIPFVDQFIQKGNEALKEQYALRTAEHAHSEQALKKIKRDMDATLLNLSKRPGSDALLQKLDKLEEEEKKLQKLLALKAPEPYPDYTQELSSAFNHVMERLENYLTDEKVRAQAIELLQSLIDKIVVTPGDYPEVDLRPNKRGKLRRVIKDIELTGELASVYHFAENPEGFSHKDRLSLVAGAGFEPATFRL